MFPKTIGLTSAFDNKSLEKVRNQLVCHYEDINSQILRLRRNNRIHTEDKDHAFPALFLSKSPTRLSEPHLDTPKNRSLAKNPKRNPFNIRKALLQSHKTQTIKQGMSSTYGCGPSKKLSMKMSKPLDRFQTVRPLGPEPQILRQDNQKDVPILLKQNISASVIVVCIEKPVRHIKRKTTRIEHGNTTTYRPGLVKISQDQSLESSQARHESPIRKFSISAWKSAQSDDQ